MLKYKYYNNEKNKYKKWHQLNSEENCTGEAQAMKQPYLCPYYLQLTSQGGIM